MLQIIFMTFINSGYFVEKLKSCATTGGNGKNGGVSLVDFSGTILIEMSEVKFHRALERAIAM